MHPDLEYEVIPVVTQAHLRGFEVITANFAEETIDFGTVSKLRTNIRKKYAKVCAPEAIFAPVRSISGSVRAAKRKEEREYGRIFHIPVEYFLEYRGLSVEYVF